MLQKTGRFLLSLILLFVAHNAFSQGDYRQGFVVTLNNDTLSGFLSYKENSSRYLICSYRKELNSETKEFGPLDISGYGFKNDHYYVSRQVMIDSVYGNYFMELLVLGKASLLRVNSKFFLEDSEGKLFELTTVTSEVINDKGRFQHTRELFKGILAWKFSDCPKVTSKIKSLTLDQRPLTDIFEFYNSCFALPQQSLKRLKPWSEFHIGFSGGLHASTLFSLDNLIYYNAINPDQFKKDKGLFGGLSMRLIFPRISESLNINIDALYKRGSHESLLENPSSYETVYLAYSSMQFPISFGYQLNSSKLTIRPNFELGANIDFTLNSSSYYQIEYVQAGTVRNERANDVVSVKKIPCHLLWELAPIKTWVKKCKFSHGLGINMEFQT